TTVWQASPHLASLACGGLSASVPGMKVAVAGLYLNTAQPQPALSAKRLLSFTMKSTSCSGPGAVVSGKYGFICGFQWIFAILAPSGKGLPLSGMPALYAAIISGLARMTATSFRAGLWL